MTKQVELVAGMKVRIKGRTLKGSCAHNIKQGAVCVVVNISNSLGFVDVLGPSRNGDYQTKQGVAASHLKLAKQANKET